MICYSWKFCTFLLLLMAYLTLISGFSKREQLNDKESKAEEELEKEMFSTVQSILKDMDDKVEEFEEEVKSLEQEESKSGVTEADVSENKDMVEEDKEEKEEPTDEKEDSEKKVEETDEEEPEETELPASTKTVLNENVETPSSASPMLVTDMNTEKEKGPDDAFVLWNAKEKVCLLARFNVTFKIMYSGKGGEQKVEVTVPKHGIAKGKCESNSRRLHISWGKYVFTMIFNKTDEDNWVVISMELAYDTSAKLFDGVENAGKKIARSKSVSLFETPLDKSFYCPAQEVILMYNNENKQVVTARMKDVHIQPYGIEDGMFSPAKRCSKVVLDGPDAAPYVQDETVPLAVGCTLALITLLILLGFSFHRAYNAAKVDYNTME